MNYVKNTFLSNFYAHHTEEAQCFVAYSGGLDSRVLLHLAKQALPNVAAVHVNHQLQDCASVFEGHCREVCKAEDIPLYVHTVTRSFKDAKSANKKLSIELFAREQRYAFFEQYAQHENDMLLLAHHQGDQAETILLNLLRGTGLDGLKGMPMSRAFYQGKLVRPLLNLSRAELEAYASRHQLSYVDDPTNTDTAMSRNFLRHEVMPLLESRWQSASKKIAETASLLQTQLPEKSSAPEHVHIVDLHALSPFNQAEQLRAWVKSKTGIGLSQAHTAEILNSVAFARQDAQPSLQLNQNTIATRFSGELILHEVLPKLEPEYRCHAPNALLMPHGKLTWEVNGGQGIDVTKLENAVVRFGTQGLTFHPYTRAHSQKLKKLFQEAKIPFWLRPVTPLIFVGDELIAVGGLGVSKDWLVKDKNAVMPVWDILPSFKKRT